MNKVEKTNIVNHDVRVIEENLASIYEVIKSAKSSAREKKIPNEIYKEMFVDFFGYSVIALDMMSGRTKRECFAYLEEYVKAENAKRLKK